MQGIQLKDKQIKFFLSFLLVLISLVTFYLEIAIGYPDIPDHNRFITKWLSGDNTVKLYSLYYLIILVLSFFQNNADLISIISLFLLTGAVLAKFMISNFVFKRELFNGQVTNVRPFRIFSWQISLKGLVLLIVFCICIAQNLIFSLSATMALGYLPVNTWHNSTTIFLMPFAFWLFYKSYLFYLSDQTHSFPANRLLEILLLTVFSVFIKPSYFFVFSVAFPLYYLLRFGIKRNFFLTGLVSLLATSALILVFRYVYVNTDSGVKIVIDPFNVWKHWTNNIPMAFMTSVLFPLLFLILYFKETLKDNLLSYAWLHMVVAVLIYVLLSETGEREIHGNFGWQTIICNFILFFCTWVLFLRLMIHKNKIETKDKVIIASFLLHVIFGCIFLLKLPIFGPR